MESEPITPVIFKMREGTCFAFFPRILGTYEPHTCSSYVHVGQHGSADVHVVAYWKPAKPAQYAELKAELEAIGYRLKVVRRFTKYDRAARAQELKEIRKGDG